MTQRMASTVVVLDRIAALPIRAMNIILRSLKRGLRRHNERSRLNG